MYYIWQIFFSAVFHRFKFFFTVGTHKSEWLFVLKVRDMIISALKCGLYSEVQEYRNRFFCSGTFQK